MDPKKQKHAAKEFAESWKGRGYEKGETHQFWTDILQNICEMKHVSSKAKFEVHTTAGGFIDCLIPESSVLIEQKSAGVDLDKPEKRQGRMVTPFEQARSYVDSFIPSQRPRFIVTCNFEKFRVYDREKYNRNDLPNNFNEFTLEELGKNPALVNFLIDPTTSRVEKEKAASVKAGELVSKLYQMLSDKYIDPDSEESQHALNVLCVRLVFCLFCEDAGLFPKDAFLNFLRNVNPSDVRNALKRLFAALDTPIDQRDPYDDSVKPFPYVNGGLFEGDVEIPNFDDELKTLLLVEVSQNTDWSVISPTIFGAMFESTLNPDTRHEGGMHYTSIENIHKVIDPLFLDELRDEFESIVTDSDRTERKRKSDLRKLHKRICEMQFLDPACGSGNFLTETYLCLRKLEDDILGFLNDGQMIAIWDSQDIEGSQTNNRIGLSQFYGIEVNDFAVRVAKTSLWIAQLQANNASETLLDMSIKDFPLTDSPNILHANALDMDWNELLPANDCSFVMGNPPFYGHQDMTIRQHEDLDLVLYDCKKHGKLDYVSGWYAQASRYIDGKEIGCAFVSTNSICQGEQVCILWDYLFKRGIFITFAHRSFVWDSEATDKAHVHCVIVGFSKEKPDKCCLYSNEGIQTVTQINGYLFDGPSESIESRSKNVNKELRDKKLIKGSQPTDGGYLLFKPQEAEIFLEQYPECSDLLRRYIGADEFIKGKFRYCLWLKDVSPARYMNNPEIMRRLEAVKEMRLNSPTASVNRDARTPFLFTQIRQPDTNYLLFPRHSSGKRKYLPIGFVDPSVIASDAASFIPNADLFMFAILSSQMHNAWLRVVCGRLKSDYRYSPAVYNSFVFPKVDNPIRESISALGQNILDARAYYSDCTLADMYSPEKSMLFTNLLDAHDELDAAVEAAYGVDFGGDEERIVAHLFKLYAKATKE